MVATAIRPSTLIISVRQVEAVAMFKQDSHHVFGTPVVLTKGFLAILKLSTSFIGLLLVEVLPFVLDELSGVEVQRVAHVVRSVNVVKTHIVIVVILLQDHRTRTHIIASVRVGLDLQRLDNQKPARDQGGTVLMSAFE